MKKALKIIACTLIASILMTSTLITFAVDDPSAQLITYVAQLLGHSENGIIDLYNKAENHSSFLNEIDIILNDIITAEQWDNSDTTLANLDEISIDLNIDIELLQRHINICGEKYFLKRMYPASIPSVASTTVSESLFDIMYTNAHTGNIFLTKDSVSYKFRHGHCGIVSSHANNKTIVEALGDRDDPEDEVVERPLNDWAGFITLAVYYPSNTTTTQRQNAGYYSTQMIYGTTYTEFVKKNQAVDLYPQMNCISLVYLSYLMSIGNGYDLIPQVYASSYLYPSHIQFSTIIALKTANNGILRTSNWNDYDWGF